MDDSKKALLAGYKPPQPAQLQAGEPVWSLRKGAQRADAELRDHGEAYGVELQLLRDGELLYGRRFGSRVWALEEAAAVRQHYEREGWTVTAG